MTKPIIANGWVWFIWLAGSAMFTAPDRAAEIAFMTALCAGSWLVLLVVWRGLTSLWREWTEAA